MLGAGEMLEDGTARDYAGVCAGGEVVEEGGE